MKDLALDTLTNVPPSVLMLGGFLATISWGALKLAAMLQASIG
tara:strand:- start:4812 stop:4940 length:129 start_codon:yes stop_codon:yes gene_type:complete